MAFPFREVFRNHNLANEHTGAGVALSVLSSRSHAAAATSKPARQPCVTLPHLFQGASYLGGALMAMHSWMSIWREWAKQR